MNLLIKQKKTGGYCDQLPEAQSHVEYMKMIRNSQEYIDTIKKADAAYWTFYNFINTDEGKTYFTHFHIIHWHIILQIWGETFKLMFYLHPNRMLHE